MFGDACFGHFEDEVFEKGEGVALFEGLEDFLFVEGWGHVFVVFIKFVSSCRNYLLNFISKFKILRHSLRNSSIFLLPLIPNSL